MHYFDRTQRFRVIRGRLCREVYASAKVGPATWKPRAVFREWEDGRTEFRNLYFVQVGGWLYLPPEEPLDGPEPYGLERWTAGGPKNGLCWDRLTEADAAAIEAACPSFRWCLRKALAAGYDGSKIMRLLQTFKEAPSVEFLVGAGLHSLALSNGLLRRSKASITKIIEWSREHGDEGLACATSCLKHGISPEEYWQWRRSWPKMAFDEWDYTRSSGVPAHEYREYLRAAGEVGKDLKDPYWRFPSDFRARRRTIERIVANRKARATREQAQALRKVAEAFKSAKIGRFSIWVPATQKELKRQADALHQCLIDMDYASRVVAGECVLVFLAAARRPVATCELTPAGKGWRIGQFYRDEELEDYSAGPEERAALVAWAKRNKLKLRASA